MVCTALVLPAPVWREFLASKVAQAEGVDEGFECLFFGFHGSWGSLILLFGDLCSHTNAASTHEIASPISS